MEQEEQEEQAASTEEAYLVMVGASAIITVAYLVKLEASSAIVKEALVQES